MKKEGLNKEKISFKSALRGQKISNEQKNNVKEKSCKQKY